MPGVRQIILPVGPIKWQLKQHPGLHGLFLVAGDHGCNPGNLVTVSIDPVVAAAKIK